MEFHESLLWYARLLTLYLNPGSLKYQVMGGVSEETLMTFVRKGVMEYYSAAISVPEALLILQVCDRSFELRHVCLSQLRERFPEHFFEQKPKTFELWHGYMEEIAINSSLIVLPKDKDTFHEVLIDAFIKQYPENVLHVPDVPSTVLNTEIASLAGADSIEDFLVSNEIVYVGDCFTQSIERHNFPDEWEILDLVLYEGVSLSLKAHFSKRLTEYYLKIRPNTRS